MVMALDQLKLLSSAPEQDWPSDDWSTDRFSGQNVNKALLESEVCRVRAWLSYANKQIAPLIPLYQANGEYPTLADLPVCSDEFILILIHETGDFAERTLDRLEPLASYIAWLEQFRDDSNIWNTDAEQVLEDLQNVRSLLIWTEEAARSWVNQFCSEYEHRHPNMKKPPIEPLDLGPTNAARLPPVL